MLQGYYERKNKHRKLTWMYTLGQTTVKGNFKDKVIELQINTIQAAILLLFNDSTLLIPQSLLPFEEAVLKLDFL